jgi:hypothetical protein
LSWGKALRERLTALLPAARAELLHVLMLPDRMTSDNIQQKILTSTGPTPSGVLGTQDSHVRRATDRLRGGPDPSAVLVGVELEGTYPTPRFVVDLPLQAAVQADTAFVCRIGRLPVITQVA